MTIIMTTTSLPPLVLTLRDGYLDNLSVLGLGPRAMRDRSRIVDTFLGNHPNLVEWMNLPVMSRCEELARTGAWPVIVYAVAHNGLLLNLELIGAKDLTGLGAAIAIEAGPFVLPREQSGLTKTPVTTGYAKRD